ncbi:hypothetical protein EYF80_003602 [Liparis tanakae]|uniref:Uncharacterized protein n=1 Tax=Liparis tanakae TaxID=230148 RepID=A0A4Z2J737_9TELE|nr:hypothetical protein EYF80_003602 [Liparis tanakae]
MGTGEAKDGAEVTSRTNIFNLYQNVMCGKVTKGQDGGEDHVSSSSSGHVMQWPSPNTRMWSVAPAVGGHAVQPLSEASRPRAAPRETRGRSDGTSRRSAAVRSRMRFIKGGASPGIQLMANIKAVPGGLEQRECGRRSSPMDSASYVGQAPSARRVNAHYQFMER